MNMMKSMIGLNLMAIGVFAMACNSGKTTTDTDTDTDTDSNDDVLDISQNGVVSDCGGFAEDRSADTGGAYCGDDAFVWSYDSTTETLSLVNTNVFLNCCGVHSMTVIEDSSTGGYVWTEIDDPEVYDGEEARCGCMCMYDYSVEIPSVTEGTVALQIDRSVSDNTPADWTAWSGTLDLTAGSGEEIIEADAGWCD